MDLYGAERRKDNRTIPWSLIVFYDQRLVQTVNFELALTVAIHLVLYTTLFILGIVLINILVPDTHWTWLWPQSKLKVQYGHTAVLLALVGIYYALGVYFLEG